MSEVLIEFVIPAKVLNMNDKLMTRWQQKERRGFKNLWREAAKMGAIAAFPGVGPSGRLMPASDLFVSIPVPGKRGRDPHNLFPTIKAICDGIVDAGLLVDDTPEFVTTHEPELRVVPPKELWKSKVYVKVVPK